MASKIISQEARDKLIESRVSKGFNLQDSWNLLGEHLKNHDGVNLVHALFYDGFATVAQAYKVLEEAA